MAVSYDNQKVNKEEDQLSKKKDGSFVCIYVRKDSQQKIAKVNTTDQQNLYIKYSVIYCPSINETYENKTNVFGMAVYFMAFSEDDQYLMVYFQIVDNYQIRQNKDREGNYIVYDRSLNSSVKDWDRQKNAVFKKIKFPNHISGKYQFYEGNLITSRFKNTDERILQNANQSSNTIYLSSIKNFSEFLVMGDIEGDIHISKLKALSFDRDNIAENINKNRLCQAKTYASHVSFVNQIEMDINEEFLFTTGVSDQCVFQWKINKGDKKWELDHVDLPLQDKNDLFFAEVESRSKYTTTIEQHLPARDEIVDVKQKIDETYEPELYLEIDRVLGRRAFNRRNNLFFTDNNRLIFPAGSILVSLTIPPEGEILDDTCYDHYFDQSFLEVDSENIFSVNPEISCLAISHNRKFVCIGTTQSNAQLLIWELTSQTFMKNMTLQDCCTVLMLKYSYDTRMVACIALTRNYTQVVYLIDTHTSQILGACNLFYSLPFKIKDLEFLPTSKTEFITCGLQHMTLWTYKGGILNFRELPIESIQLGPSQDEILDRSDEEPDVEEKKDTFRVTFLSLLFIMDEFILTAGDDGHIFIWKDFVIAKKVLAHKNIPVVCLAQTDYEENIDLFVSGGMNGTVILWQMAGAEGTSEYSVRMVKVFELFSQEPFRNNFSSSDDAERLHMRTSKEAAHNPMFHIQSLQYRLKHIIVGTRSGDIYFLQIPDGEPADGREEDMRDLIKKIYTVHDNELPKEVGFSPDGKRIFCITQKGLFSSWNYDNLRCIVRKSFMMPTVAMLVLKKHELVIIAFEKEIRVLDVSMKSSAERIHSFDIETQYKISDVKISQNEEFLAIALDPTQEINAKIEIYLINYEINKFGSKKEIEGNNSKIEFMDFSTDDYYLMYKDSIGQKCFFDLANNKKNDTLATDFDIEWVSEGIKISEKRRGLDTWYNEDNNVICVVRAGERSLIATDEIGTIRLFEYPCTNRGYYQCYSQHLNFINTCHYFEPKGLLITASSSDRCVYIWKVNKIDSSDGKSINHSIHY